MKLYCNIQQCGQRNLNFITIWIRSSFSCDVVSVEGLVVVEVVHSHAFIKEKNNRLRATRCIVPYVHSDYKALCRFGDALFFMYTHS